MFSRSSNAMHHEQALLRPLRLQMLRAVHGTRPSSPVQQTPAAPAIYLGSTPGQPRRLRTMIAVLVKCPSRLIFAS
jgi:hypothetical protein